MRHSDLDTPRCAAVGANEATIGLFRDNGHKAPTIAPTNTPTAPPNATPGPTALAPKLSVRSRCAPYNPPPIAPTANPIPAPRSTAHWRAHPPRLADSTTLGGEETTGRMWDMGCIGVLGYALFTGPTEPNICAAGTAAFTPCCAEAIPAMEINIRAVNLRIVTPPPRREWSLKPHRAYF